MIRTQAVDARAAFERLSIIRKAQKELMHDLNNTNTVDIAGEHKALYQELEIVLLKLCLQEQNLIDKGE